MKKKLVPAVAVALLLLTTGKLLGAEIATIQKCTSTAGKTAGLDSITLSGLINATADHLSNANAIVVTLDADDMPAPLTTSFAIDTTSFKNGRYNSPRLKVAKTDPVFSFKYDTRNGKLSFSGKTLDLTGLACPMTIRFQIGDYSDVAVVEEDIVNGPKKPCPPQFLMGVRNWMAVDKAQVKINKKPGADSLNLTGFFAIAGNYDTRNPMTATLGGQTFTVSGDQFTKRGSTVKCTKGVSAEGPQVRAKFDFSKCTFQIQVLNAAINDAGQVGFGLDCFGHELPQQQVAIPSASSRRYELERYRCYDRFGRNWTYMSNYTITYDDGWDDYTDSRITSGMLSVANSPVTIDGHPCYSIYAHTADATVSSTWYEDYYGMHQYSWGNVDDMFDFNVDVDALLVMPKLLSVGQTHKTSGAFTGNYELDLGGYGMDIDIYDFKGKVAIETTLLGFEDVTVPYGTFSQAAKVRTKQRLTGSMMLQVAYYGEVARARMSFSAVVEQTWWGGQDIGIVKSEAGMYIKMSGGGESMSVSTTVADQLTNYAP